MSSFGPRLILVGRLFIIGSISLLISIFKLSTHSCFDMSKSLCFENFFSISSRFPSLLEYRSLNYSQNDHLTFISISDDVLFIFNFINFYLSTLVLYLFKEPTFVSWLFCIINVISILLISILISFTYFCLLIPSFLLFLRSWSVLLGHLYALSLIFRCRPPKLWCLPLNLLWLPKVIMSCVVVFI